MEDFLFSIMFYHVMTQMCRFCTLLFEDASRSSSLVNWVLLKATIVMILRPV